LLDIFSNRFVTLLSGSLEEPYRTGMEASFFPLLLDAKSLLIHSGSSYEITGFHDTRSLEVESIDSQISLTIEKAK